MDVAAINAILEKFPEIKGNLMAVLHEVQDRFHYLPEAELRYIAKKTGIPIAQIYSVAKFYNRFSLEPKGKNRICVCMGTACHVKGGERLMDEMKARLKIDNQETTDDLNFSLDEVRCIGACSLAPAMVVNEDVYGKVSLRQVAKILSKYNSED